MKRLLLILGLSLIFCAHAKGQACSNSINTITASSLACSSAIAIPAGDVAIMGWSGINVGTAFTASGCGTWDYEASMFYGGAAGAMWVLPTSTSSVSSCTPTIGFTSAANVSAIMFVFLLPAATWEVEYPSWTASSLGTSYTLPAFNTVGPNDTVFAFSIGNGTANNPLAASSPWTSAGFLDLTVKQLHIAAFEQAGLTPGTVASSTFTNSSGISMAMGYVILRNSAPTFGRGQIKTCTTGGTAATAPFTCQLNHKWIAGDTVYVAVYESGSTHNFINFIDSADTNVTCVMGPGLTNAPTFTSLFQCSYNGTPPSTPTTFRADEAGAGGDSINVDMDLIETVGGVKYLSGNTSYQIFGTAGLMNPQISGNANPRQLGSYYVIGVGPLAAVSCASLNTETFTVSAGYSAMYTPLCANSISYLYDGVVNVSTVGQTVSSSVNTGSNTSENSLQTFIYGTQPYLFPTTLQTSQQHSTGGSSIGNLNEPTSNGTIVVCGTATTMPTAWSINSTPLLTWTTDLGGGTSKYIVAHAGSVPAGSVVVTASTGNSSTLFTTVTKFQALGSVDVTADTGVVAGDRAPSSSNLTLTPNHTNEFGIACTHSLGTPTGSNNYFTGITSTVQQPQGNGFSDDESNSLYNFSAPTIQAYGGFGTSDSGEEADTMLNIVMFPGTNTPPASSTQPFVNIITKNNLKHWEGEFTR